MMLLLTYRLEELSDAGQRRALFADMNAHFEDPALATFFDRIDGLLIEGSDSLVAKIDEQAETIESLTEDKAALEAAHDELYSDRDYYKTLFEEARDRENGQTEALLRWAQLFKEHGIDP
jgi:hypothetical protein